MKVLAVSASPRKGGNSDVLCDQLLKGASESGNEVEKINLSGLKISPCVACYGCRKSGRCVKKDDMERVLDKLIHADVIILATPVYFYFMDAQMKIMIDRCLPRYQEIGNADRLDFASLICILQRFPYLSVLGKKAAVCPKLLPRLRTMNDHQVNV